MAQLAIGQGSLHDDHHRRQRKQDERVHDKPAGVDEMCNTLEHGFPLLVRCRIAFVTRRQPTSIRRAYREGVRRRPAPPLHGMDGDFWPAWYGPPSPFLAF